MLQRFLQAKGQAVHASSRPAMRMLRQMKCGGAFLDDQSAAIKGKLRLTVSLNIGLSSTSVAVYTGS
jgi:hypothetical protein